MVKWKKIVPFVNAKKRTQSSCSHAHRLFVSFHRPTPKGLWLPSVCIIRAIPEGYTADQSPDVRACALQHAGMGFQVRQT